MGLGDGIRKHGFRKWYERELLSGHAWLVMTFLCTIGLFGAFESMSRRRGWNEQIDDLAAIAVCSVVGLWSLRRYLRQLMHAEATANQAVCADCGAYGRLGVAAEDRARSRLRVRCKRCAHEWWIEDV